MAAQLLCHGDKDRGDIPTANDILSPILNQKCCDHDGEGFQIISQLLMARSRRKYGHKVGEKDYLPPAFFYTFSHSFMFFYGDKCDIFSYMNNKDVLD